MTAAAQDQNNDVDDNDDNDVDDDDDDDHNEGHDHDVYLDDYDGGTNGNSNIIRTLTSA